MFSKNTIPATGGSFGLERIITVMDELDMFPANLKTSTEVLVTVFNPDSLPYSIEAASVLRAAGIKVDLYTEKAKLNKQFKFANEKQIPFVIVAGPDEAERREVALKQMESGDQETVKLSEIATRIKALLER